MLGQFARHIAIALLIALLLPSCARFSSAGRQQLAYARYIKKYSGRRTRQQAKFKKVKMPATAQPGPSHMNTGVNDGPQSVSSSE
jgi:hypothetical protein